MMENGAVWLHRSADKNDVLRHPIRFSLFFRCVMRACWKERSVIYRGKQILLQRGQLAWSVRDMADGVGCSIKEIRTALKHLKLATMLDTDEGTVPQVITVLNYNDYQAQIEKEGTLSGTLSGTVGAQEGHSRGTQNNKDKKEKKEKNIDSSSNRFDEFWAIYPKKVGRKTADEKFNRALRKFDADEIIDGAKRYAKHVAGTDRQFIANPATWLNQERWTDDLTSKSTGSVGNGFSTPWQSLSAGAYA